MIKAVRNLLKKLIFLAGNADWVSELPSVIKIYNNTIHSSIKMNLIDASKKKNETEVYSSLRHNRVKQKPKYKLGELVRTADIKRVFSKGGSTNWSYKLNTVTEVMHDIIPSNPIEYLSERYNENLLKSTNLTLDENIEVLKELNLFQ